MFPIIECFHLLALSLLGGAVLVVDLRLLGLGLKEQSTADIARKAQPWLNLALFTIIATGIPMFLSEAVKCFYSPPFWYKIGTLIVATAFAYTLRRKVALAEPARVGPIWGRVTALASMGLWFGVAFAGRWIAFY
jgi:hypothetical protein